MSPPTQIVTTSPALRRLLLDHQTWCRAHCCKSRAFRFTEESIARWLAFERIDRAREIAEESGKIQADSRRATGRIFLAARGLESDWASEEFQGFWGHFEQTFTRAIEGRVEGDA